jgi:hypothetical protein
MSGEPRPRRPSAPSQARILGAAGRGWGVLRERLLRHSGLKLGALLVAAIFWLFVRTDETVISQRTLRAPLNVEGVGPAQTVLGVPERIEVRLSGPSNRISSLNPEGVDAVLDLRGVVGEFEQPVRVFPPEGITLLSVNPTEVLGRVELHVEKPIPVRALGFGEGPADSVTEIRTRPAQLTVSGAETQVARVTQALVPVDLAAPGAVGSPYAADAEGAPVRDVVLTPETVALEPLQRPVMGVRRVPLVLGALEVAGGALEVAALSADSVRVVGPREALAELSQVVATPAETFMETPVLAPGQYTLEVSLALPEGVAALDKPQLEVRVGAPASLPGGAAPQVAD